MTQAEIISANSMAALAFRDERTVSEILGALRAKEEIEAAAIYTPDGRVFAVYHRDPQRRAALPSRPEATGYRFDENALRVFHGIVLHEQSLGTLYIQSDMQQWYARLRNYTAIVGILMLGAALFALLLSSRMQRVISQPILDLEQTMRTVSATEDLLPARHQDAGRRDRRADRRLQRDAGRDPAARRGAAVPTPASWSRKSPSACARRTS